MNRKALTNLFRLAMAITLFGLLHMAGGVNAAPPFPPVPGSVPENGWGAQVMRALIGPRNEFITGEVHVLYRVMNETDSSITATVESRIGSESKTSNATTIAAHSDEIVNQKSWFPQLPEPGIEIWVDYRTCVLEACSLWESRLLVDYRTGATGGAISTYHWTNGCLIDSMAGVDPDVKYFDDRTGELIASGHLLRDQRWSEAYGSWLDVSAYSPPEGGTFYVRVEFSWADRETAVDLIAITGCVPQTTKTPVPSKTPTRTPVHTPRYTPIPSRTPTRTPVVSQTSTPTNTPSGNECPDGYILQVYVGWSGAKIHLDLSDGTTWEGETFQDGWTGKVEFSPTVQVVGVELVPFQPIEVSTDDGLGLPTSASACGFRKIYLRLVVTPTPQTVLTPPPPSGGDPPAGGEPENENGESPFFVLGWGIVIAIVIGFSIRSANRR